MLAFLGDFFLSEWIWSITWGMYHIPINMVVMFVLSKFVVRVNNSSLFLIILLAHVFALLAFTGFVVGMLVFTIGLNYLPSETSMNESYNILNACISLGIIYAVLQSLFFALMSTRYTINVRYMSIIAFLSNLTSAQLVYFLFPYK